MKLSIITVNLNNRDGLQKTIDSVICQTFTDFEWIVIDGGSTDGSKELIQQYAEHFAYWVSEPDEGIYNAMNKGIRVAKGEYLQFLNSGDCLYETRTLKEIFAGQYSESIVFGDAVFSSSQGNTRFAFPEIIRPYFFFDDNLCHQATFFRRELLQEYMFDEEYKVCSDLDFLIKSIVIDNRSYKHLDITVCVFDKTGISSNSSLVIQERDAIIHKYFPENIIKELLRLRVFDDTTNPKLKRNIDIIAQHTNPFRFYKFITKLIASLCPSK